MARENLSAILASFQTARIRAVGPTVYFRCLQSPQLNVTTSFQRKRQGQFQIDSRCVCLVASASLRLGEVGIARSSELAI
jgi:hypothetical protein